MNDRHKPFLAEIKAAASQYSPAQVFEDACRAMADCLWSPLAQPEEHEKVEADWQAVRDKYTEGEWGHIVTAFALLVEALEARREDFLGHCLEELGAANTHNGQFLTPIDVSRLMADIEVADLSEPTPGRITTLNDPACGAGVLLIEGAEALLRKGWRQGDVLIEAGDVDRRAADMTYIQLALLGYPAVVRHEDALTQKEYSPPRYTPGYYFHGLPARLAFERLVKI